MADECLGQAVVVDNKPGASETIGVAEVLNSTNGPLTTANKLIKNLPCDVAKDVKPHSLSPTSALVLISDPALATPDLKTFLVWAKTQKDG